MKSRKTLGHISALITILIWGGTFTSIKLLLEKSTPLEILFLRFLIGFAVLCIIYPKTLKIKKKKFILWEQAYVVLLYIISLKILHWLILL